MCPTKTCIRRTDALVVLACLVLPTVAVGPASFDALDALADLVGGTVVVAPADLLANVVLAQFVGEAVAVCVTDGFAETSVALETMGEKAFSKTGSSF